MDVNDYQQRWDRIRQNKLNSDKNVHECDANVAQSKEEPMVNNSLDIVSGDSSKGGDLEVSQCECNPFNGPCEYHKEKGVASDRSPDESPVVSHPCTDGNSIEHDGSVIEFCYRWPDKRIEVKYRRVSGTVECDVMLNEIKTLQEKFGEECPYFWRFENGIH